MADRLLILFDGACGICLHGRDLLLRLDRRGQLAAGTIQEHTEDLLAGLPPVERDATWHVIHPDGRRQEGGAALTAVVGALPGGRLPAAALRRAPRLTDRAYRSFAAHRTGISQALRLNRHPEKLTGSASRNGP